MLEICTKLDLLALQISQIVDPQMIENINIIEK